MTTLFVHASTYHDGKYPPFPCSSCLLAPTTAPADPTRGDSTAHPAMPTPGKPSFPPLSLFPLTSSSVCPAGVRGTEEDILYQWRLRRKLEQAHRASATLTGRLDGDDPLFLQPPTNSEYGGKRNLKCDNGHSHTQSLLPCGSVVKGRMEREEQSIVCII